MAGIGETLRAERRQQGRSLADVAAETRVRESYLAAIEEDDFDVLGGDVYARGFIRLYGRYLDVDAEALVATFRSQFERAEEVTRLPGSSMDDFLPHSRGARLPVSPPVLAAVGLVALAVFLFVFFRAGAGDSADVVDPDAPGPSPAEVSEQAAALPTDEASQLLANTPADPLLDGPAPAAPDGPVLDALVIDVAVLRAVRLTVVQGQPPVSNATLEVGDVRRVTAEDAVVFQVSDAGAVDVTVNGLPLVGLGGAGQAVQVSCIIGSQGCEVEVL